MSIENPIVAQMAKSKKADKPQPDEVILAGKKLEKSQTELREILEIKLKSLKIPVFTYLIMIRKVVNGLIPNRALVSSIPSGTLALTSSMCMPMTLRITMAT